MSEFANEIGRQPHKDAELDQTLSTSHGLSSARFPGQPGLMSGRQYVQMREAQFQQRRKLAADGLKRSASYGVSEATTGLPFAPEIQKSFGKHSITDVQSAVGGKARSATEAMGAEAYATGNKIAFKQQPDLHTAAHEAAHVIQQRAGVQLKSGIGQQGDAYEVHADQVADLVVQGKSAESLLSELAGKPGSSKAPAGAVQHKRIEKRTRKSARHHRGRKRVATQELAGNNQPVLPPIYIGGKQQTAPQHEETNDLVLPPIHIGSPKQTPTQTPHKLDDKVTLKQKGNTFQVNGREANINTFKSKRKSPGRGTKGTQPTRKTISEAKKTIDKVAILSASQLRARTDSKALEKKLQGCRAMLVRAGIARHRQSIRDANRVLDLLHQFRSSDRMKRQNTELKSQLTAEQKKNQKQSNTIQEIKDSKVVDKATAATGRASNAFGMAVDAALTTLKFDDVRKRLAQVEQALMPKGMSGLDWVLAIAEIALPLAGLVTKGVGTLAKRQVNKVKTSASAKGLKLTGVSIRKSLGNTLERTNSGLDTADKSRKVIKGTKTLAGRLGKRKSKQLRKWALSDPMGAFKRVYAERRKTLETKANKKAKELFAANREGYKTKKRPSLALGADVLKSLLVGDIRQMVDVSRENLLNKNRLQTYLTGTLRIQFKKLKGIAATYSSQSLGVSDINDGKTRIPRVGDELRNDWDIRKDGTDLDPTIKPKYRIQEDYSPHSKQRYSGDLISTPEILKKLRVGTRKRIEYKTALSMITHRFKTGLISKKEARRLKKELRRVNSGDKHHSGTRIGQLAGYNEWESENK